MVAMDLKAELMKLMDKRSELETEMNVIIARLTQPGGAGLAGNLLDSEGFPRSDIDIPVVRADRNRLVQLRNDHKDITEKISQKIELLHSVRLDPKTVTAMDTGTDSQVVVHVSTSASSNNSVPGATIGAIDMDISFSRPFAMVNEITEESPAAEDGLQLGDQLIKFGNVEYGDNLRTNLSAEAQTNQGRPVPVVVMRQGTLISLSITPRTWQGSGLMGCNFHFF